MAKGEQTCGSNPVVFCKVMIAFISLSTYLVMNQLDFISRHFAVAFNIPTHNIGIYFNKLYSLRCLTFVISAFIENGIFQAAGGDVEPEKSTKVRRYVGIGSDIMLLTSRCVYLFILYRSSNLSYHIYMMMVVEGLCFGFFESGFMTLGSEYMSIISPFYNVSRIFVSGCQFILDRIWYHRPLLMIKIQAWIAVIFTSGSVGLWYYYNIYIKSEPGPNAEELLKIMKEPAKAAIDYLFEDPKDDKNKKVEELQKLIDESKKNDSERTEKQTNSVEVESLRVQYCRERVGRDGIGAALSPLLLYWSSTMFKDFLFPATLPYGLLTRDKCHIINVMIPIFMNIGPVTFFVLDNFTDVFGCWSWYFDMFWVLFIPLPILLTFVLRAIFTRDPSVRRIINSQPRVACMTLAAMFSFGCNEPLSYIGLAKYAFRQNPGGFTIMGYHVTSAFLCRALFAKISIGFSDTRISLGYHLPKFRPNHRMSKKNLYMYLFRETFRRALRDFKGDFKLDIKKYL